MHYLYILQSRSLDKFYIGETANPENRLAFHLAGTQRYTKRASDWVMCYLQSFPERRSAMVAERKIKKSKNTSIIRKLIISESNLLKGAQRSVPDRSGW